ncbi:MAG: hypothetical protein HC837_11255 [Chloroflexaceae bacterium]|nr:hypothetical protein [Chloroflexaceae bacterium]
MSYALFLEPEVHAVRGKLPGHIRERMQRAITALAPMGRARQGAARWMSPG